MTVGSREIKRNIRGGIGIVKKLKNIYTKRQKKISETEFSRFNTEEQKNKKQEESENLPRIASPRGFPKVKI